MKSGVSTGVLLMVAAITATAALIGALGSAWIAARSTRKSMEQAAEEAETNRKSIKDAQHRASRRDAYAAFMVAGAGALRAAEALADDVSDHDAFKKVQQAAIKALDRAINATALVSLEGPQSVADHALEAQRHFRLAMDTITSVYEPRAAEPDVYAPDAQEEELVANRFNQADLLLNAFRRAAHQHLNEL
ncbi:hypothetical protein [Streptomyces mesophilus]|uniref:hypothetical protein n=1 Tax=Streptomyces mesophilus TaxID=1775132 RepID=UPI00331E11A0